MTSNTTRTPSTVRTAPAAAPPRAGRGGPRRRRRPQGDLQRRPLQRPPRADRHLGPARPARGSSSSGSRPLREGIAQVVYEAGPTGFALARRLRAEGFRAEVIAPSKTPGPGRPGGQERPPGLPPAGGLRPKGLLQPVRVPTEQEEADRQVLRLRGRRKGKASADRRPARVEAADRGPRRGPAVRPGVRLALQ